MVDFTRCLPTKVFCCIDMHNGAIILMSLIILFRFIGMILGCLYGPFLYLVLPIGGLYLAADVLLLYTIFGSGLKFIKDDNSSNSKFQREIQTAIRFFNSGLNLMSERSGSAQQSVRILFQNQAFLTKKRQIIKIFVDFN